MSFLIQSIMSFLLPFYWWILAHRGEAKCSFFQHLKKSGDEINTVFRFPIESNSKNVLRNYGNDRLIYYIFIQTNLCSPAPPLLLSSAFDASLHSAVDCAPLSRCSDVVGHSDDYSSRRMASPEIITFFNYLKKQIYYIFDENVFIYQRKVIL